MVLQQTKCANNSPCPSAPPLYGKSQHCQRHQMIRLDWQLQLRLRQRQLIAKTADNKDNWRKWRLTIKTTDAKEWRWQRLYWFGWAQTWVSEWVSEGQCKTKWFPELLIRNKLILGIIFLSRSTHHRKNYLSIAGVFQSATTSVRTWLQFSPLPHPPANPLPPTLPTPTPTPLHLHVSRELARGWSSHRWSLRKSWSISQINTWHTCKKNAFWGHKCLK